MAASSEVYDKSLVESARSFEITASILRTSNEVMRYTNLAFPRKRFLGKIDRTPKRKQKREYAKVKAYCAATYGVFDLYRILATPIPRFPMGSDGIHPSSSGFSIVKDVSEEFITGMGLPVKRIPYPVTLQFIENNAKE